MAAIVSSRSSASPLFYTAVTTRPAKVLDWKKELLSQEYLEHLKTTTGHAYCFEATVTPKVALEEFGVEIPSNYELHAKVVDPERAHIVQVLQASVEIAKAHAKQNALIAKSYTARMERDKALENGTFTQSLQQEVEISAKSFNRALTEFFIASLKKWIAENNCGIHCTQLHISPPLELVDTYIPFLTSDDRMLILKNLRFVSFSTFKNLIKSGLTLAEKTIPLPSAFTPLDPDFTLENAVKALVGSAHTKQSEDEKKA